VTVTHIIDSEGKAIAKRADALGSSAMETKSICPL